MSAPIEDGGPAFPRPGIPTNWAEGHHAQHGMTLRDYFAGQALAGILGDPNYNEYPAHTAERVYGIADAMLAAREAKP